MHMYHQADTLSIVNHHMLKSLYYCTVCIVVYQVQCIVCAHILDNKLLILLKLYFDICFSGFS